MLKERPAVASYLAAAGLAGLTIFVFWAFQNYGPESSVRRLHTVVSRFCSYVPPEMPYDPSLLRREDALELESVLLDPIGSRGTRIMIDFLVRPAIYGNARFSIYKTDYPSPRTAVTAALYSPPMGGIPTTGIFVVQKPVRSWRINARRTVELAPQLPGPAF
jgi:hypothetical protein